MSDNELLGQLLEEMRGLNSRIDAGKVKARDADGGREAAAIDGAAQVAGQLSAMTREQRMAEISEAVKAQLATMHLLSAQGIIGQGPAIEQSQGRLMADSSTPPHPALKASFRDYRAGELLSAFTDRVFGLHEGDVVLMQRGKAKLDELGTWYGDVPAMSKATLGTTGATGGYVLPNNLVDTLVKPNTQEAVYTGTDPLLTVINGVNVRGVDLPYRTGAPARMEFQNWGATKENVDEAYGSYTALLGTMARIYDIGKQYARFSAGAAERDVIDELTKAAALGENYYAMAGAGTGTLGSGDVTTGIYTAIVAGAATYTTAAAAASNSTVAGSVAAFLAGMAGTLATRSRRLEAVVMDATTYWRLFSQGSDNAGFWMSALLGAGFQIGPNQSLTWNGVPLRYDANLGTNTATKILIGGEFKAVKFFRGMEFRIDTSDVAGDRWDKNLIGFRGEEEIAINASTAVSVGALQLVTAAIP